MSDSSPGLSENVSDRCHSLAAEKVVGAFLDIHGRPQARGVNKCIILLLMGEINIGVGSLNAQDPPYLFGLIKPNTPAKALRPSNQLLLVSPRTKLKSKHDRAFAVMAPNLWNTLPLHIRAAETVEHFKSLFKTHLFSLAFNSP